MVNVYCVSKCLINSNLSTDLSKTLEVQEIMGCKTVTLNNQKVQKIKKQSEIYICHKVFFLFEQSVALLNKQSIKSKVT